MEHRRFGRSVKEEHPFAKTAYIHQVISAAPALAIKALGDLPRGAIETGVESAILHQPADIKGTLRAGTGKAVGNAALGILTGPIFVSGIKDLQSDDPGRKAVGAAKIIGSSSVYTAGKMTGQAIGGKLAPSVAARRVLSRTLVGLPAVFGTAFGVGRARAKDRGPIATALMGAAGGAAGGALKGVGEVGIERLMRKAPAAGAEAIEGAAKAAPSLGRAMLGRAGGLAASGALGGLILGAMFDRLSKAVEPTEKGASMQKLSDGRVAAIRHILADLLEKHPSILPTLGGAAAGAITAPQGKRLMNAGIWGAAGGLGSRLIHGQITRALRPVAEAASKVAAADLAPEAALLVLLEQAGRARPA